MSGARYPRLRKVVFALLPVVVLLLGVEVTFRLRAPPAEYFTRRDIAVTDPDLLWRLRPYESGPLATNELGLRDTPFRREAESRVLLLGDSVSWGHGVDDVLRVYPQVLERRFNEENGEQAVEIVNAGVPGYSTFQELAYLERDGFALEPDAVVLQFSLNDVLERYRSLAVYGGATVFLGADTRRSIGGLYGVLLRHSRAFVALVRFRYRRARAAAEDDAREAARSPATPVVERAWQTVLGEVEAIRMRAEERGLPLLLFVAPYRFQTAGGWNRPQERLAEYARMHALPVVDSLPLFQSLSRATVGMLFNDEGHFSACGHAVAAEVLLAPLEELLGETSPTKGDVRERTDAVMLAQAAASLAKDADYPSASRLLDEAERLEPGLVLVHQYRANVAYLEGRLDEARAALERGLELEPDNALLRANLRRLGAR